MEPATSSTQTVKIPPAPADIIQNRKLGFLFAQDLFGIKKEKQQPFTEKFHDYTVRDIVSRCLFKCIKDQKPGTEESYLFAASLHALLDLKLTTNENIVEILKKYLKIEEDSTVIIDKIKLSKFERLVSCLNVDQAWIIKENILKIPFIQKGKIFGLLAKIMETSLLLLPHLSRQIEDCLRASKPLKDMAEKVDSAKNAGELSHRKVTSKLNSKKMNEERRISYERLTSDKIYTTLLKTTKSVCQSASTRHYDTLFSLQNWKIVDSKFWFLTLKHIKASLETYTNDFGNVLKIQPQNEFNIEKETEFNKYDETTKIALSIFAKGIAKRNDALNNLRNHSLIHYTLLRFITGLIDICIEHLGKEDKSEINAKDFIAEIEDVENKRKKKVELVSEECIDQFAQEEEIEVELPFNSHQEVKLLSPREMLKRGLNDILEDFLRKNNCDDLTALSQSAAFLCKIIHKNPRFVKEEYPKLAIYESRALKAAFNDATDHLFLSFCGFEIFAKSMQEGRLFSLGLLLRMLIQDWHGTSEQARRVHSIVKYQKTNDSHHLLDFNEMENGATKEYLQALDNGLVWSRYPISNAESLLPQPPLGLHWMKFCYKFQSKILQKKSGIITDKEIHQIHQLIDFICNCQFNVWIDACHLLSKDCDFIRFPEVLGRVKAQMKVWASALKGKQFAELGAENVLQPQQEILDLLSTLKQKLIGTSQEVKAEAGNIKRHLTELHTAVWLKDKNDKKRFDALFDRNLLNLQWVLEASYRILAAMKNINRIKDHDLSVIQRFLRIAGANISDEEEQVTASYNLHEMQYYPHYVKFTRGNLSKSMVDMLAKIKLAQRLCLHAETDLISPAIPDQTFQNGLRVVSHHFSLIPNKKKHAR